MGRSVKKGSFIDQKLLEKIRKQKTLGKKEPIKTWARDSQIPPSFVGHTFLVHNGRIHLPVFITEAMVGYRLGEFASTRTFRGHGKVVKKLLSKT